MASNNRSSGTAAFRYASALVELAVEGGAISQIESDVATLRGIIESSKDFKGMTQSPLVNTAAQQAVLMDIAEKAKLSNLMANFLMTLAQNRRLSDIEMVLKAVSEKLSSRRGEMRAQVQTATALTPTQSKNLEDTLAKSLGHPVAIDATVKPELIGGVTITLGSLMIDDSIKTKLDSLARAMKHNGAKAA